jgi:Na+-translocating ferredoxin:NAD+ oxidoreductase subunit A
LLASLREETRILNIPKLIHGTALNLIIAGIVSLGFMGFAGLFGSH